MQAAAVEFEDDRLFETIGTVEAAKDGSFEVRGPGGSCTASRAVSCLVTPVEGDVVLLAGSVASGLYVLAVLKRGRSRGTRISMEGDLEFELGSGRLTLSAAEGVELVSSGAVSMTADRIDARAREGGLLIGSVKLVAGVVETTLDRLSQTAKRVYRRVIELEHVRAGQVDYVSDGNMRLHGCNTLVTARELLKADGEQIHVG